MNFSVNDNRSYVEKMYSLMEAVSDGGGDSFFAKPKNATIEPLNTAKQDGITAPVEVEPGVDDPLISPKGASKSSGGPAKGSSDKKPAEKSFGKSAKGDKEDDKGDKGDKEDDKEPKDKGSDDKAPKDKESKDKEGKNPFQKSEKKDTDKEKTMSKEGLDLTFEALYNKYISESTDIDGDAGGIQDEDPLVDPNALPDEEGDTDTEDSTSVAARMRMIASELNDLADEISGEAMGGEGEEGGEFGEEEEGGEFDDNEFKESVNCDGKLKPAKKSTLGPGSSQVVKGKLAGKRGGKAGVALKKRDATGNPVAAPKSKFGPKMSPVVKSRITGKNQELFQ